jgi:hypothetical protein
MRKGKRFSPQRGIALGPILFIIAILAILAGAIAAGNSGFSGSTSKENAKIMASTILQQSEAVSNCVQVVRSNGYNDTQISFQVPAGTFMTANGQDNGQITPLAECTTDACQVYMIDGGGCSPQTALMPQDAFDQTYVNNNGLAAYCPLGNNMACRAPDILLTQFLIEGASPQIHLSIKDEMIKKDVCMAINNIVGIPNPSGDAPQGVLSEVGVGAYDSSWYGGSLSFDSSQTYTANKDFCFGYAGVYIYIHVF